MPLATRKYGIGDLMRLRRRENKDRMRRWFFQALEQGVKCRRTEHMNFVYYIDLIVRAAWRQHAKAFNELANIIDTIMRRAVNFTDRKISPLRNTDTLRAFEAGGSRRPLFAVKAL